MQTIPIITLTEKYLFGDKKHTTISLTDIIEKTDEETPLYLFDTHAICGGETNFDIIRRLSQRRVVWLDAAPQNAGDIIDFFLAGAKAVIIRPDHWKESTLHEIKQYSENPIYLEISQENTAIPPSMVDGFVLLNIPETMSFFQQKQKISSLGSTKPVYVYQTDREPICTYDHVGSLVDLTSYKKVNK